MTWSVYVRMLFFSWTVCEGERIFTLMLKCKAVKGEKSFSGLNLPTQVNGHPIPCQWPYVPELLMNWCLRFLLSENAYLLLLYRRNDNKGCFWIMSLAAICDDHIKCEHKHDSRWLASSSPQSSCSDLELSVDVSSAICWTKPHTTGTGHEGTPAGTS